jgi:hypothetical protein
MQAVVKTAFSMYIKFMYFVQRMYKNLCREDLGQIGVRMARISLLE